MAQRRTALSNGEYYHVYNRGSSKQVIFHDEHDHKYFQNMLNLMNSPSRRQKRDFSENFYEEKLAERIVSIGAYCLMPNHFHILLRQEKDEGVSLFMKKMLTSYAMYYNKKYKRTGVLFEGRFKSKHVDNDMYHKYLFAYIHLNPLKIVDKLWKERKFQKEEYIKRIKLYPYSSFVDYCEDVREESLILNKIAFPDYFPRKEYFLKEIMIWLHLKID